MPNPNNPERDFIVGVFTLIVIATISFYAGRGFYHLIGQL